MATDLRVVVDTNVIISQLLMPKSVPAAAVRIALRRGSVLSSAEHIRELFGVMARPKFDRYVPLQQRLDQIRLLVGLIEPVQIESRVQECRDPKDNLLLEIAVNGGATHIVTGDDDLLILNPFRASGS